MSQFNIIAEMPESTVVSEYITPYRVEKSYQTEAELEAALIDQLKEQGYERLSLKDEASLIANLRRQLERLNQMQFSDSEWAQFFRESLANPADRIEEKSSIIQSDYIQLLTRDDGSKLNIKLIDKNNVHNNALQVINQYVQNSEYEIQRAHRYDVTILVNGFPLVHIELKRRGVALQQAFNNIERYQRDSFWTQSGLFEYVQIFVISNGTNTKYYSNTTRQSHVEEQANAKNKTNQYKKGNSFEYTSFWADAKNRVIPDLVDFTKTFFAKHTLLNVLCKYCVWTSDKKLLVMRPYQIAATERILTKILISSNYRQEGTIEAGGYVWHTTGSGKTLTSFKTAQLATGVEGIDKVLFVVDRKDLDYQTIKEYDRFQKGAANSNRSTKILKKQLEDPTATIIVTTIQKLSRFIEKNPSHSIYDQHLVMIFDECHRSQFGEMNKAIKKHFKKWHLFGFTGTPIFAKNAAYQQNPLFSTTDQVFGKRLHSYTIVDAIQDHNVLPFRIDYINTIREREDISDQKVSAIDSERLMTDPQRIAMVSSYILEHFDQKTKRQYSYNLKTDYRVKGFNSIFAVSSIKAAKLYYSELKKQIAEQGRDLVITTIFSYQENESVDDFGLLPDESFDTADLDQRSRDFLDMVIDEYNQTFNSNFSASGEGFENYYKDVSQKVKERKIDILIVVNMFLTGFDATTLNTLWVDKNLRYHGLIQAFSRTNRILNSVKTYGNIVCFRNLSEATDEALALFGDKEARSVVLLRNFDAYFVGYEENGKKYLGYVDVLNALRIMYPVEKEIVGETAQKDFVKLFGQFLKLRNILSAFDQFEGKDPISERELQDYRSMYLDIKDQMTRLVDGEKVVVNDDVVFEMELMRQVDINIDYILLKVAEYHKSNCRDKKIIDNIRGAIEGSSELRSKRELILKFLERVNLLTNIEAEWQDFVEEEFERDLDDVITRFNLRAGPCKEFMRRAFAVGELRTTGTDIDEFLPPLSLFGGQRIKQKRELILELEAIFERYLGLIIGQRRDEKS